MNTKMTERIRMSMNHKVRALLIGGGLVVAAGALAGWDSVNATEEAVAGTQSRSVGTNQTHGATAVGATEMLGRGQDASQAYDVDSTHSGVTFKVRHRGVANFHGQFSMIQGTIEFNKLDIEQSTMQLVVPIKSVYTGDRTRDGHIKGADFLNMRQYPEATFQSTSIKEISDGVYTVTGNFTLQGKTVSVVARMDDVQNKVVNGMKLVGFEAQFSIKRSDFGITKHIDPKDPENGALGDLVEMTVFVEVVAK